MISKLNQLITHCPKEFMIDVVFKLLELNDIKQSDLEKIQYSCFSLINGEILTVDLFDKIAHIF